MNEELKKTVRAVQGMEQYDESVKQVLAHKIILANILVNIEAQKDEPTSYYIQNRAVFYACRMVSSQKERDFTGMNYNDNKKSIYNMDMHESKRKQPELSAFNE